MADFDPTRPGEILKTEFLEPMSISQYRIAKAIDVPPRRINEIESPLPAVKPGQICQRAARPGQLHRHAKLACIWSRDDIRAGLLVVQGRLIELPPVSRRLCYLDPAPSG